MRLSSTACMLLYAVGAFGYVLMPRPHQPAALSRGGLPILSESSDERRFALPPAMQRDVAAEALAAAAAFRPSSVPLFRTPDQEASSSQHRSLLRLIYDDGEGVHVQFVGEIISNVTSGARAGTTWTRPLALKWSANSSLARAADAYDPLIGWCGATNDVVYIFTKLAPAAFVPTQLVEAIPTPLALAVRSMSEAHADAAATDLLSGMSPSDTSQLYSFMRLVSQLVDHDAGGRSSTSYDPLA